MRCLYGVRTGKEGKSEKRKVSEKDKQKEIIEVLIS